MAKTEAQIAKELGATPLTTQQEAAQLGATRNYSTLQKVASYPAAVMSGSLQGLRDIGNLGVRGIDELTGSKYQLPQPPSLNTELGLPQHPTVSSIASYLPAMASSEAAIPLDASTLIGNLVKQAGAGGLYGASQAPAGQIPLQASVGAAVGAGTGAAGKALGSIVSPAVTSLAKNTMPTLLARIEAMSNSFQKKIPESSGAKLLQNAYGTAKGNANWSNIANEAQQVDTASKVPFDTTAYQKSLKDIENDLVQKANMNPKVFDPLVKEVDFRIDNAPSSYQEAVQTRSAINDIPSSWDKTTNDKTVKLSRSLAGKLGNALDNQTMINSDANPAANNFFKNWLQMRKNYGSAKGFEQLPVGKKEGALKLQYYTPLSRDIQNNDILPDEIMSHFMPKKGAGINTMQHYGQLIDNESVGKNVIRDNYLQPSFSGGEFNPDQAVKLFNKLSTNQQDYLFDSDEKNAFNQYNRAKTMATKKTTSNILRNFVLHSGMAATGGLAGGLYGESEGKGFSKPALVGAILGGLVPSASQAVAPKFASSRGLDILARLAKHGTSMRGLTYPAAGVINPLVLGRNQNAPSQQ